MDIRESLCTMDRFSKISIHASYQVEIDFIRSVNRCLEEKVTNHYYINMLPRIVMPLGEKSDEAIYYNT